MPWSGRTTSLTVTGDGIGIDPNAPKGNGLDKRAKIIGAEGESLAAAALGEASDTMMAHPLALQLRTLQSLVEIGVDKNTTVVFPAQSSSSTTAVRSLWSSVGAFIVNLLVGSIIGCSGARSSGRWSGV